MAIPDDASIAPAFGRRPEPIWSIGEIDYDIQHWQQLSEYTPPEDVLHMHWPSVLDQLWCRVLHEIRNPVQVHADNTGRRMFQILGQLVLEVDSTGRGRARRWICEALGQSQLSAYSPVGTVQDFWPPMQDWLEGWAAGISREVEFWGSRKTRDAKPWAVNREYADAYTDWALSVFRAQMAQHCDLELMDARIRRALGLFDPQSPAL